MTHDQSPQAQENAGTGDRRSLTKKATGPEHISGSMFTPATLAGCYGLGLTKVYEECRSGVLKDVCVRWGRRIYIPATAAARIFEGEVDR